MAHSFETQASVAAMKAATSVAASGNVRMNNRRTAEYLGISESTLNKMRLSGRSPRYVKISAGNGPGGRILYNQRDVDEWLESQSRRSTSEDAPALKC